MSLAVISPRALVLKFRDVSLRDKVWNGKKNLKGTGITLSEFLTKDRHELFLEARRRFGITKCWTRGGTIYILGNDGTRHRINTKTDLNSFASSADTQIPLPTAMSPKTVKDSKPLTSRSKRVNKK
ncbi:unnamed protein product [Euphydryas editha]|uniref:Uncharacterized protein n=1 Tax=Euphydryas editha TaxID=104508 RepID=A0AAU9UGQ4_EUPED|nr:unnamed protein product [Euphydryas editha]